MLEKLLFKLGYIPKKKYEELETTLKESNELLDKSNKTLHKTNKQITQLEKQLKYSIEQNEELIVEINSLKTTNNDLYQKNNRLEKLLKEVKRKEVVLLKKQGNFKEKLSKNEVEIDSLNKEIIYLNQKIKLLESYSYAVVAKLEELCFGSVLPKVMKQMDLSKYLYPLKPIKIIWSKENGDIKVEAVGVQENNEEVS